VAGKRHTLLSPFHSGERHAMKQVTAFLSKALVRGLLIVVPVCFAILLLLKGMQSVTNPVRPLAQLLPA
jgi:hypothetical protein